MKDLGKTAFVSYFRY